MRLLTLMIALTALWLSCAWAGENRIQGDPVVIGQGNIELGDSDTAGTCKWFDVDGAWFKITAADMAANFTYVWPVDDGDADEVLQTDGAGILTWADVSAALEDGTADGQMLFWDTDTWKHTEVGELVWDDTNKWMGIGQDTPLSPLHVRDAASNDLAMLEYDNNGASGPKLEFYLNSDTPADNDVVGVLEFSGEDSNSDIEDYVRITAYAEDVTHDAEDGGLAIEVQVGSTLQNVWDCWPDEVLINGDGVDIDFTVEGENDTNLLCTDAANDRIGVSDSTPDALVDIDGNDTTADPTLLVERDLASGSTDSPVVTIHQDNAGDDQDALSVQQDCDADAVVAVAQAGEAFSGLSTDGYAVLGWSINDDGIVGSSTSAANDDYSIKALEHTYLANYADYYTAHALAPMTAPPADTLRTYADTTLTSRLYAKDSSSNEIDLSIQSDHVFQGQWLADTEDETWEDAAQDLIACEATASRKYDFDFVNMQQDASYGQWVWDAVRAQMALNWAQCQFATGGQIDYNGCTDLTLRALVWVNCATAEGAAPGGTYWDSIKFYVTESNGEDNDTVSADLQGQTSNGAWTIIEADVDVSAWSIGAEEALRVGLVFVGEDVADPGMDPQTTWTYEVRIEWIKVTQWVE